MKRWRSFCLVVVLTFLVAVQSVQAQAVQVYRDANERLYLQGLAPGASVYVLYENRFKRVTARQNPNRCNLVQFWNTRSFRLYATEGTRIYLPSGDVINFDYRNIPQAQEPVCVDGQIAAGLPWQSIAPGVEAVASYVTGWSRSSTTFMILVRGLPADGVFATDFKHAERYGRANRCGVASFGNTPSYENSDLGNFSYRIGTTRSDSFNWETLPTQDAPPRCRNGVFVTPAP